MLDHVEDEEGGDEGGRGHAEHAERADDDGLEVHEVGGVEDADGHHARTREPEPVVAEGRVGEPKPRHDDVEQEPQGDVGDEAEEVGVLALGHRRAARPFAGYGRPGREVDLTEAGAPGGEPVRLLEREVRHHDDAEEGHADDDAAEERGLSGEGHGGPLSVRSERAQQGGAGGRKGTERERQGTTRAAAPATRTGQASCPAKKITFLLDSFRPRPYNRLTF